MRMREISRAPPVKRFFEPQETPCSSATVAVVQLRHPGAARARLACRGHLTQDQQVEGPQAFARSRPRGGRNQQEGNRRQGGGRSALLICVT